MPVLFLILGLACSALDPAPPAAPAPLPTPAQVDTPDILLVVVDTLRADRLGFAGHGAPTSPRIDALAADGASYSRAYAHSGWTLPSFASLLSGTLPSTHRVVRHPDETERFGALAQEFTTLGEVAKAQGYRTGAVLNNTFLAPSFGLSQGFDSWDYQGAGRMHHCGATETVQRGLDWIHADPSTPTLTLIHLMEPHLSYAPPEPWKTRFTPEGEPPVSIPFGQDWGWKTWQQGAPPPPTEHQAWIKGLYDAEIRTTDEAVGALLDGLAATGRLERTVVVLTADHGEELFDRGGFEHGHHLMGELTRVPLVLWGPGIAQASTSGIVAHTDLYQTLVGTMGAQAPPGTQGQALDAPGRTRTAVVADGNLYGDQRAAIVDARRRVVLDLATGAAQEALVDTSGAEGPLRSAALDDPEIAALLALLTERRGGGAAIVPAQGPDMSGNPQAWSQLKELGYVDDR